MSESKLEKMDRERRMKARADALRRKDEKRNEEIRKKAMEYKEEHGSFEGLDWGNKDTLTKIKDSFKGKDSKFKKLIKRLKD